MRKIFTLLSILSSLVVSAQRHFIQGPALPYHFVDSRSTTQTIQWAPGSVPTIYASPYGGYVCGTDGFGTIQNAQVFTNTQSLKVVGALIWFAHKDYLSNDTNSKLIFKVSGLDFQLTIQIQKNYLFHL